MTIASDADTGEATDDGDVIEVHLAGDVAPWIMVPQWLMFAVSGNALKTYALLLGHVNAQRGDRVAYPTLEQMRRAFPGLKQARTVSTYVAELVKAGALDVVQTYSSAGMRSRNRYILRHNPPDAFAGPRSVGDFHRRLKAEVSAARPVVRSNAVRREQGGKGVSAGRPVVRSNAVRTAPQRTPVLRPSAPQLDVVKQEQQPPHAPLASHSDTTGAEAQNGGGDPREDFDAIVTAVRALRPGWSVASIQDALGRPEVLAHPAAQRGPALLVLAADPATVHPNRLAIDGPWWKATAGAAAGSPSRRTTDLDREDVAKLRETDQATRAAVDAGQLAAIARDLYPNLRPARPMPRT